MENPKKLNKYHRRSQLVLYVLDPDVLLLRKSLSLTFQSSHPIFYASFNKLISSSIFISGSDKTRPSLARVCPRHHHHHHQWQPSTIRFYIDHETELYVKVTGFYTSEYIDPIRVRHSHQTMYTRTEYIERMCTQ